MLLLARLSAAEECAVDDTWADGAACAQWASAGECASNAAFMLAQCAGACARHEGERRLQQERCPRDASQAPALVPGTLAQTFAALPGDFAHLGARLVSTDPPVAVFDHFLSDEEAQALIAHGSGRYSPSLTVAADGRSEVASPIRTSAHAWCQSAACLSDPRVRAVSARVANVTRTAEANAEYAMLVYYHACADAADADCAFYRRHSDYIAHDIDRPQGVRIFTLYCYLSDVEEGGATRLTDLPGGPLELRPRRGRAALWASVLDATPDRMDVRTHHEALPVTRGDKYGAVFWIHQYDFKTPHARGCAT